MNEHDESHATGNEFGLTDDEFWASLDREIERAVHGGSITGTGAVEARLAKMDRESEGL